MMILIAVGLLGADLPAREHGRKPADAIDTGRELILKRYFDRIGGLEFDYGKVGSVLEAKHFAGCKAYGLIGSRGSVEAGFDREFDVARDEFDLLQSWLLKRRPAP